MALLETYSEMYPFNIEVSFMLTLFRSYCPWTRTQEQASPLYEDQDSWPTCERSFLLVPILTDLMNDQ
jgi:hypothetical protein